MAGWRVVMPSHSVLAAEGVKGRDSRYFGGEPQRLADGLVMAVKGGEAS